MNLALILLLVLLSKRRYPNNRRGISKVSLNGQIQKVSNRGKALCPLNTL